MAEFIEPEMVSIIHPKPQKSMTISMVHLPKGKFMFGKYYAREVHIDYEFEIGKFPVTFEEYDMYCEDVNIKKPKDYGWGRGKRPVIHVSWYDAVAFCEWLSEKSGQDYRLPTEVEWEYACRAGTTTKWSFGDDEGELGKYAWYDENHNSSLALGKYAWYDEKPYDLGEKHKDYGTHIVGEKEPNSWGIYDMHGNVWEWCEDWYDKDKDSKVVRGGSWFDGTINTGSAIRGGNIPTELDSYMGFRLLRTLP